MTINASMNIHAGMLNKDEETGMFGTVSISGKKREEKEELTPGQILSGQFDPIEQKKALAKKQAYQIVRDALALELKMDSDMDEVRAHSEQLKADMAQAQEKIGEINAEKEKWREECGVDMESEEQKDLELLEKREAYLGGDLSKSLSDEEMKRLSEIDAKGYTDYQKKALSLEKSKAPYETTVKKAESGMIGDNAVLRGTRLERLKKDRIRKAQNEKDEALAAASKEVLGMLVEEAKDHIDEKSEELQEKAEERAEEKEEQEEKLDAAKEKKAEMEAMANPEKAAQDYESAQIKPVAKDEMTEAMVQLDGQKGDYQREIEEMMQKMKLMSEDIKGIKINETL